MSAESHSLQFILNDLAFNFQVGFKIFNVILFIYFWLHWIAAAGSHSPAVLIGGLLSSCGVWAFLVLEHEL